MLFRFFFFFFKLLGTDFLYPVFELKYSLYMLFYELELCVPASILIHTIFSEVIFLLFILLILSSVNMNKWLLLQLDNT